jgi:aminotransferase
MHDFMTVGAPAPLQEAGAVAMALPDPYYAELAGHYQVRRDRLLAMLRRAGFDALVPKGAYYIMCDVRSFLNSGGFANDIEFCRFLVKDVGVAAVPGSSFFGDPFAGRDLIRFTFCKKESTLAAAEERLVRFSNVLPGTTSGSRVGI